MKSHREVLIRPIALSVAAILLTSLVAAEAYSHAKALHVRDPEDLPNAAAVTSIGFTGQPRQMLFFGQPM